VKLLLDQNLSHRLIPAIETDFPDSAHVRDVDLASSTDEAVWSFAKDIHSFLSHGEGSFLILEGS
jgi:predicted nuclease of predicted toxin-antitoxin system